MALSWSTQCWSAPPMPDSSAQQLVPAGKSRGCPESSLIVVEPAPSMLTTSVFDVVPSTARHVTVKRTGCHLVLRATHDSLHPPQETVFVFQYPLRG